MKALDLLKTNKTVEQRADAYATSIKRDIQRNIIDTLVGKKEKLDDELFELTNFTLNTNINQGLKQMTKEDCLKRFERIIEVEYELDLTNRELEIKQKSFDKYFKDEQ